MLVSNKHPYETDRRIDLSQLNEAERRVLRLLAEGHTAKSIATALETTSAAVNERLREARRKTGVGSSRELARLLRAQESRDDQLGVGRTADAVVSLGAPSGGKPARSKTEGLIAMTGLLLTGLVATSFALQQNPVPTTHVQEKPFADPLIGNIFAPADPQRAALIPTTQRDYVHARPGEDAETALRRLHAEVRAERQDELAFKKIEAMVAAVYKQDHPIKLSKAPLRVICSTTLCEVATTTETPTPEPAVNALLNQVQGPTLRQRAAAIGLEPNYMFFGLHPRGDRAAYLGYWTRSR